MVAVWQEYQDNKRVFNIEVTAMGEAGPTTRGGTVGLDFVAPSLTVPETMTVNYDDVLMQYFPLSSGGMTRNDRLLSKWHPTRTGLPLFDGSPTGDQFEKVNGEIIENASDRNQLAQLLLETLIGQIPLSNLVTGGTELLKVMTADQTETTTQLVGGTELDPPNPNEVDTVGGVSPITSFSTVYQIPVQFGTGGTGDRHIRADIEWATKFSKMSETPDRWRFEQAFTVTPRNPTTPATTPSTTDTITTSFEDADVGAQSPTDPFYLFNSGGTHEVTDTDASDGSQLFYTGEAELRNPSAIAIDLDLIAYETLLRQLSASHVHLMSDVYVRPTG